MRQSCGCHDCHTVTTLPYMTLRIDSDCIVPYLTLAKSTRFYYVNFSIWLGCPSVQYDNFCAIPRNAGFYFFRTPLIGVVHFCSRRGGGYTEPEIHSKFPYFT
jgi:hypothetical protein